MSSKRRLRRKSCTGKQRHDTEAQAVAHALSEFKRSGERLEAYRCRFGAHYHVGHESRRHA